MVYCSYNRFKCWLKNNRNVNCGSMANVTAFDKEICMSLGTHSSTCDQYTRPISRETPARQAPASPSCYASASPTKYISIFGIPNCRRTYSVSYWWSTLKQIWWNQNSKRFSLNILENSFLTQNLIWVSWFVISFAAWNKNEIFPQIFLKIRKIPFGDECFGYCFVILCLALAWLPVMLSANAAVVFWFDSISLTTLTFWGDSCSGTVITSPYWGKGSVLFWFSPLAASWLWFPEVNHFHCHTSL